MMKKFYVLMLLAGLGLMVSAQTQRRVLVEEATNASCGPCASQNPAFDALLQANPDKVAVIKYHWYFPGTDPMNAQNPDENNGRVAYYGINGVPTAIIDGVIPNGGTFGYPGAPSGFTQSLINQYYNTPSPLEMAVYEDIDTDNNVIDMYILLHAVQDASGSLRSHVTVVEKHIHFTSAPGGNGEKDFYDVMKKMLPDENGTPIDNMEAGDYMILHQQWDYNGWTIYDEAELNVISWVQSANTKTVLQSAIGSSEMFEPLYNLDVEVAAIKNVPSRTCAPHVDPVLQLRNNGDTEVTSMEISYYMNGEEAAVYNWSGSLGFLDTEEVELPGLDFDLMDENDFHVEITAVNGIADEYAKNNIKTQQVMHSVKSEDWVRLLLRTDNNPEEITWEIVNSEGEVVFSGGPYEEANHMVNEVLEFDNQDCYLFTIYDAGGDGICCENGTGFFALSDNTNTAFVEGGNFDDQVSAAFKILKGVGVDEFNNYGVNIYPNPAADYVEIVATISESSTVSYEISDLAGRVVYRENEKTVNSGTHTFNASLENIQGGVYLVRLTIGEEVITKKMVIKK